MDANMPLQRKGVECTMPGPHKTSIHPLHAHHEDLLTGKVRCMALQPTRNLGQMDGDSQIVVICTECCTRMPDVGSLIAEAPSLPW